MGLGILKNVLRPSRPRYPVLITALIGGRKSETAGTAEMVFGRLGGIFFEILGFENYGKNYGWLFLSWFIFFMSSRHGYSNGELRRRRRGRRGTNDIKIKGIFGANFPAFFCKALVKGGLTGKEAAEVGVGSPLEDFGMGIGQALRAFNN